MQLKSTDKIKIQKMYQSDFGVIWPVYEVRITNAKSNVLLCKCEGENTADDIGLKKAELIRDALVLLQKTLSLK
jgi:hypothetical protein